MSRTKTNPYRINRRQIPLFDNFHYPDGRKKGLKKDKPSKIVDRCDPIKSVIEPIARKHWEELRKTKLHLSKRERFRFTLDQDGVGSCASEATDGAGGACDKKQGFRKIVYNPWGRYHYTSGGRDNGSVIGDNVKFAVDKGRFPEDIWPRSKGWREQPGGEAHRIAKLFTFREFFYIETIEELVSALLQGFEVVGGYSGHAVAFTMYLGQNEILFKNSWGNWGENGFGRLSLSKVYFPYGCYGIQAVTYVSEEDYTPRHNQDRLELAVNQYMDLYRITKKTKPRSISPAWEEDNYNECLEAYGLSV